MPHDANDRIVSLIAIQPVAGRPIRFLQVKLQDTNTGFGKSIS
jgi:hypothetical protein